MEAMTEEALSEPDGSDLVDLLVDDQRKSLLREVAHNLPDVALNERQMCDFELLATGAFSPLKGFMTRSDYESVLDRMRLQNGTLWPSPVCLDIPDTLARKLEVGQSLAIRDPEGFMLAVMHVEDLWEADRQRESRQLYRGLDPGHPCLRYLRNGVGPFYAGGGLEVLSLPLHYEFKQLRQTPTEIRAVCRKLGWQRILGFPTGQLLHRPQFEAALDAMRGAKANLLLLPVAGLTVPGDFDFYTRVRCFRQALLHFPPDAAVLNLLPLVSRVTGEREALLRAIVSRNYGCSHCLVEPDHLSVEDNGGAACAGAEADVKGLAETYGGEIGVEMMRYRGRVYLPFEDLHCPEDEVPPSAHPMRLTNGDIRNRVRTGRNIPDWATFPEVVAEIRRAYPPPVRQGFTVFLTGLSGAGKSTVARILYARFLEIGGRPVTLLDGDIVRRNLSSELSFSKEHRDINVRRIGFVAEEITKNRGIAICAPIAPYRETRREIREAIECWGGFVEAHVCTPLTVCERRDRKGMYAKARAGLIQGFTGVDDPYEAPESPELRIDTSDITPDEAAQEILLYLGQRGYI
jgi:sulfate adenylyltransferase